MFIQVITGKVTDADGFRRQDQKWNDELRPGATGFLGSTAGTTSDGRFLVAATVRVVRRREAEQRATRAGCMVVGDGAVRERRVVPRLRRGGHDAGWRQ